MGVHGPDEMLGHAVVWEKDGDCRILHAANVMNIHNKFHLACTQLLGWVSARGGSISEKHHPAVYDQDLNI